MNIKIPSSTIILIIGGPTDRIAETATVFDGFAEIAWFDTQKPDRSVDGLRAAIKASKMVCVAMPGSHPKARTLVASIARKHGAAIICLRLPGGPPVIANAEKIDAVYDINDERDFSFEVVPMPSDLTRLKGPFDIIGDVHGCADELLDLLTELGHAADDELQVHPDGRIPVLLGDLTDRGPKNLQALQMARRLVELGGLLVIGNHCEKLHKFLHGKNVRIAAGLATTIAELDVLTDAERIEFAEFLSSQQTHLVLDGGNLVVAHAGLTEDYNGRHTQGARSQALYGVVTGEMDGDGYPVAEDFAQTYRGKATVVHGHVVYPEPRVLNNVVAIDTGCVFGGKLTAYRYPERTFVSIEARQRYFAGRL